MKSKIIEIALQEYGVHETSDPNTSNPRVLEYFAASGNSWVKDDSANAWCSAFANYVVKTAGLPITGSLLARSWLTMGQPTTTPEIGDLVIFWRDDINSTHGHVSIFIKQDGDNIYCLGGNQSDAVDIAIYPASRVLGFRDITLPATVGVVPSYSGTFVRTLKLGDSGEDVKLLQQKIGTIIDGSFGSQTQIAVKVFQELHGLTPDGIVGPLTQAQITK